MALTFCLAGKIVGKRIPNCRSPWLKITFSARPRDFPFSKLPEALKIIATIFYLTMIYKAHFGPSLVPLYVQEKFQTFWTDCEGSRSNNEMESILSGFTLLLNYIAKICRLRLWYTLYETRREPIFSSRFFMAEESRKSLDLASCNITEPEKVS